VSSTHALARRSWADRPELSAIHTPLRRLRPDNPELKQGVTSTPPPFHVCQSDSQEAKIKIKIKIKRPSRSAEVAGW
jgi:hypothetical protein